MPEGASGIPQASIEIAHLLSDTLRCLQLWLRLGVMAYFLLCMGLLWLVRSGTCAANQFVDTGVMPMHVRLKTAVPALLIIGNGMSCVLYAVRNLSHLFEVVCLPIHAID